MFDDVNENRGRAYMLFCLLGTLIALLDPAELGAL